MDGSTAMLCTVWTILPQSITGLQTHSIHGTLITMEIQMAGMTVHRSISLLLKGIGTTEHSRHRHKSFSLELEIYHSPTGWSTTTIHGPI